MQACYSKNPSLYPAAYKVSNLTPVSLRHSSTTSIFAKHKYIWTKSQEMKRAFLASPGDMGSLPSNRMNKKHSLNFNAFLRFSCLVLSFFALNAAVAQKRSSFSQAQIDSVLQSGSGLTGPGKPVAGSGWGGWRSGSQGVAYIGANAKPDWSRMSAEQVSASIVKKCLLPPIIPILDAHIRDAVIIVGGDGAYYLTGSTGDNIWAFNDGVELWRSTDLKDWKYLGLVWSIEKDGTWEKEWRDLHGKPARAIWAPELHYVKGNYYICLSMAPGGIAILKSTTGKPEGPYVHATNPNKPFVNGIDATLFEDEDGKVYFTWSGASRIGLMKNDLSDFAEPVKQIILEDPDLDSAHHAAKCMTRGSNDLGHEGAVLFKANGKYYLSAADDYEGRYSTCVAIADNIYGPYKMRHESVPCAGGTNFFKAKDGSWYSCFFGNDNQSPWREKPGIVRVEFDQSGKVKVAKKQPDFILLKDKNLLKQ
jgi:xylan 1,4-beta-xylosidase